MFVKMSLWVFVSTLIASGVVTSFYNKRIPEHLAHRRWGLLHVLVMAIILPAVFMGIVLMIGPKAFRTRGWTAYTSPEGRFRVDFPGTPLVDAKTLETPDGPLSGKMFGINGGQFGVSFLVQYTDYPPARLAKGTPEQQLVSLYNTTVKGMQLSPKGSQKLTLAGHPGLELTYAESRGIGVMKARYYLVKDRMYILWVGPVNDTRPDANAERFFGSFKLLP